MPPYHDDHEASIIPQIYYGDIICLVVILRLDSAGILSVQVK